MTTKLIRDRVVDLPWDHEAAKAAVRPAANEAEVLSLLRRKLLEEVGEFLEAEGNDAIDEAADVLEVMLELLARTGVAPDTLDQVTEHMLGKRDERGGFERGLVLSLS